jgi:hypothetical protein
MGLQMVNIRRDSVNDESLGKSGRACLRKFKVVTTNILRNVREENLNSLQELLNAYKFTRLKASEIHFLDSHLYVLVMIFHQKISTMGKRQQGNCGSNLLADHFSKFVMDVPHLKYKRKSS